MQDTIDLRNMDKARKTLGLSDSATLKEIKESYRELVRKYHPDKCGEMMKKGCEKRMKEINKAYKLIMEYCESYRYSLTGKEKWDLYLRYVKGFQEDWMWASRQIDEKKKENYRGI